MCVHNVVRQLEVPRAVPEFEGLLKPYPKFRVGIKMAAIVIKMADTWKMYVPCFPHGMGAKPGACCHASINDGA